MATLGLIEYKDASPEVRAVYDDIMTTRKTDWINNFWKAIAHDPVTLKRTWEDIKQIMAPGALDPLTKEMIYVAVSVSNQCDYCIASHTASAQKKGMTNAMFKELMAVVGMANETNRLVAGYQVEVDEQFKSAAGKTVEASKKQHRHVVQYTDQQFKVLPAGKDLAANVRPKSKRGMLLTPVFNAPNVGAARAAFEKVRQPEPAIPFGVFFGWLVRKKYIELSK
jgi:AhpD family alkylhydroperoxidase